MTRERTVDPVVQEGEQFDFALRPKSLREYVGQEKQRQNLEIFLEAAKKRDEALEHLLLAGPPGLGKTTLAHIMANELGVHIRVTSGPALERAGDVAAILTNLEPRDILFIDEIHRLSRVVEETLYPAMEDFKIDVILGQGPSARTMRLDLPRFTLVGATTRTGLLSSPLRDRFGINMRLDFYTDEELQKIVRRAAQLLRTEIDEAGSREIARRSRGTPRIAGRLLRRIRDFAQVSGDGKITLDLAAKALESLGVDGKGLDNMDRRILLTIIEQYDGGPVGLETLSATIGEESETLEDVYEPFLIKEGLLQRTPKGRMATLKAYEHFKRQPQRNHASRQQTLDSFIS